MKRPGPPPKGRKPYTGTKPAKGQEKDPGAGRRKKAGGSGYPRAPEERRPAAEELWPASKPVRAGRPGLETAAKPERPARGRAAAIAGARQGGPAAGAPGRGDAQPREARATIARGGEPRGQPRNDGYAGERPPGRGTFGTPRGEAASGFRGGRAAGDGSRSRSADDAPRGRPPGDAPEGRTFRGRGDAKSPRASSAQADSLRVVTDTHASSRPAPAPSRSQRRGETGGEPPRPLPSMEQLQIFFRSARAKVGRNEIARHFGLVASQRSGLKALLDAMPSAPDPLRRERQSASTSVRPARADKAPPREARTQPLPEMLPVEIFGTDADGDPLARPLNWDGEGRAPVIRMQPERPGQAALAPGERVLARIRPLGGGRYEGRTFQRIAAPAEAPGRILGIVQDGRIVPTDRRQKGQWAVSGEAREGDIVLAEPVVDPSNRHFGPKPARVTEVLGRMGDAKSVSLICIHAHGIPTEFPPEAVQQAERAKATPLGSREDLRDTPLVTIDGEDARDFDDAVFAEEDGDGWRVIVAIADVAHYVPPGSALDLEARRRGNSVYFPDRVVPMLPEALSNGWCSLRPHEERGCLFVEMRFDARGDKQSHRFGRGLMRSVARLTYEAAQAARDEGGEPAGLPAGHMARLYGAFVALLSARGRRGTLELDIPERRVVLSPEGQVTGVAPRPRLDSHKLIEEFMIAANVCAAEELERLVQPTMYRIHDRPSDQKLEGLRQFLQQFAITMPPGNQLHPRNFSHVLEMVKGAAHERLVNETVLRSQSQAAYAPDNIGHFGLSLARYSHFTSPIRRYADLMVHRALIRGLKLGRDGITEAQAAEMPEIADAITATERRAAAAERDAVDRYMAAFMADRVGEVFPARISGVTRFGLFVAVDETGAQGMIPFSALPEDRWEEDVGQHALVGRRSGMRFTLGDAVEVALREANAMTGSLQFSLRQGPERKASNGPHRHRGKPRRT